MNNQQKICKKCKEEINKAAKKCPKCGAKQGLPIWLIVLIIIVSIGILGIAMGGEDQNDSNKTKNTNIEGKTQPKQEKLVLENGHKGSTDEYNITYSIEGTVKNTTDKEYSYVQIEFSAYDKKGNNLGTCMDNNSSLDANGSWKFKAICDGEASDIASYKLKELSGY